MASRASVYLHRLLSRTRLDNVTASACNGRLVVIRMNIALHDSSLPFKLSEYYIIFLLPNATMLLDKKKYEID